jgi:hypothetical protein
MEAEISSLKLALLRDPHVDQLMLPGMEDLHQAANEGEQKDSHRGDMAS